MTASWPSDKIDHYPLSVGYGFDFGDRRARTPFEQGETRHRSSVRSAKTGIRIAWAFTPAKYEIFRAFRAWTVSDGADEFTMPIFTGSDYETLTVRFVKGSTEVRREGGEWIVNAKLETDELPTISSGDLDDAIGTDPGGLPAWPSEFPAFAQNPTLVPQFPDAGLVRSDFDVGLAEQRRIFVRAPVIYRQDFIFGNAEFDLFKAWRKFRINSGEGWFAAPIFEDKQYASLPAKIVAGRLQATVDGGEWRVTTELELQELPQPAASVLA